MSRMIYIFVLLLVLAGCAVPSGVSREAVESKGSELDDLTKSRIVSVKNEPYLGARAVSLKADSGFTTGPLAQTAVLNRQGTLLELCSIISKDTGLPITVDTYSSSLSGVSGNTPSGSQMDEELAKKLGVNPNQKSGSSAPAQSSQPRRSIYYKGNLKGLLDLLSAKFGQAWEYTPGEGVVFSLTAVRTFTLWAAPGQITFNNNITNQSKDQQSSGGIGSSAASVSMQETSAQTAQMNSTSLTFDIWKDVEAGVKNLLSPNGSVMGNQAAGTITVRDTAPILKKIEKFIDETNERLSRQIALSIKVWSLELADSADIGLSLSMFFENPDVRVFAGSVAPRWQEEGGELSAAIVDGKLKDSTGLLKALRSVGRATQLTSGGGVVMSNQPVPIQAIKREAYLAGSSISTTQYGETTQLTPGEITTGFAMTVIPHILEGRRVVLQYTINLSSLDDLTEFSSGDSKIQLPKVSSRSFSQRMTIKMGQTLVLAGFEQELGGQNTSGGLLGIGRSKSYKKSLVVITISTESGDV